MPHHIQTKLSHRHEHLCDDRQFVQLNWWLAFLLPSANITKISQFLLLAIGWRILWHWCFFVDSSFSNFWKAPMAIVCYPWNPEKNVSKIENRQATDEVTSTHFLCTVAACSQDFWEWNKAVASFIVPSISCGMTQWLFQIAVTGLWHLLEETLPGSGINQSKHMGLALAGVEKLAQLDNARIQWRKMER